MDAEVKPRIALSERVKLENHIPLETPFLVFIDPSSICNQECSFCPTGHRRMIRKYYTPQVMSMTVFKKVVDELGEFPEKIKTVRLYKDGEPLINPNIDIMVNACKAVANSVELTTNGILLSNSQSRVLIDAGLDKIFISVPRNYTDTYRKQVEYFFENRGQCHVHVKMISNGQFIDPEADRFLYDFTHISDSLFVENMVPCWPTFFIDGEHSGKGIYGQDLAEPPAVCPYIFYSMSINAEGSVSMCFLDWKHRMIVGTANSKETLKEIWNGSNMFVWRLFMLTEQRKYHEFCGRCQQLVYGMPDNIDEHAKEILRRL